MWSCCTSYNEAKEEVVGDSTVTDERFEPPAVPQEVRVRVSAIVALDGSRELRCVCAVPGRATSRVDGEAPPENRPSPRAAFEASVPGYITGESLSISLLTTGGHVLGEAVLQPSVFHPCGFSGELAMTADGRTTAYAMVSIAADDGLTFPPLPATVTGYRATIEVPAGEGEKSLDLDFMDRTYTRVNGIRPGPVLAYNEKVGPLQRVQVDDFIYSVNSVRSRELLGQLRKARLGLLVRRPLRYNVAVAKSNGALGLDLWYEHDSSPALLVTRVNEGPVSQWNLQHPERRLGRLDRIVGVNGRTGCAAQLLQLIREATEHLELDTVRPHPEDPPAGPVEVGGLTRMGAHEQGLLPQPAASRHRAALLQVYSRGQDFGGGDKSANGHRYDSVTLANGLIESGVSCQLLHYVHQEHGHFFEVCSRFDAVLVRCGPEQLRADGGDAVRFEEGLKQLRKAGVQVWPPPELGAALGARERAAAALAGLPLGLEDAASYASEAELAAGLRASLARGPRVLKPSRGFGGEGVWLVRPLGGGLERLSLTEASDGHEETHSLAELLEFCSRGRTERAGAWASRGAGGYLAAGPLLDQRFCARVAEGVLSYQMVGEACVGIVHKKPREGGFSAAPGAGAVCTFYGPEEERFAHLTASFLQRDWPRVMPALGLPEEPAPLWWSADFVLESPVGTPASEERWVVCDFNCCAGISRCLAACCGQDNPTAGYADISAEDRVEARRLGSMIGSRALGILKKA